MERVEDRRGLFDTHTGLIHKSFLYNKRERLYAPFYIWKDVEQARDFIMDKLFHGVVETFARHRVRSWYVVNVIYGNKKQPPVYACRDIDIIPQEEKLSNYIDAQLEIQQNLKNNPYLHMHVLAVDVDRWEILQFSLWNSKECSEKSGSDCCTDYNVLHVSEPV